MGGGAHPGPARGGLVVLSATVSNAEDSARGCAACAAPPTLSWRSIVRSSCATTWPWPNGQAGASTSCRAARGPAHPRGVALDAAGDAPGAARGHAPLALATPRRSELVEALDERSMLPAIVFIFSRAACDDAVAQCLSDGLRLTTPEQRLEIRRRCEEHTEGLSDDELRVLEYGPWVAGLEAGVASHHAGMIPAFREAVEDCFSAGLLRVAFATETLALGINMPARTVVIERLTKVREHGRSRSHVGGVRADSPGVPGAGARLGRACRHGVVPGGVGGRPERTGTSPAPELRSSFRPTYNLAVNLVRRYPATRRTSCSTGPSPSSWTVAITTRCRSASTGPSPCSNVWAT